MQAPDRCSVDFCVWWELQLWWEQEKGCRKGVRCEGAGMLPWQILLVLRAWKRLLWNPHFLLGGCQLACVGWRSPHGFCRHRRDSVSERGVRGHPLTRDSALCPQHATLEDKGTLSVLIIPHLEINEEMAGYRQDGDETLYWARSAFPPSAFWSVI